MLLAGRRDGQQGREYGDDLFHNRLPVRVLIQVVVQVTLLLRNRPEIVLLGVELAVLDAGEAVVGTHRLAGVEAVAPAVQDLVGDLPADDVGPAGAFEGQFAAALAADDGLEVAGATPDIRPS